MLLSDKLEIKFRLDDKQKKALRKLSIFSVSDLLFHFPVRYSNISEIKKIADLSAGEIATVYGQIVNLKTKKGYHSKISMGEGEMSDLSGKIKIIWFNQPYLAKMIQPSQNVKLTGKVTQGKQGLYLANPEFEKLGSMPIDSHDSLFSKKATIEENGLAYPIYHETQGITSKWIYHAIEKILREKTLESIEDYIPQNILKKYNLPSLATALVWIHRPKNAKDSETARKRFAFEEVFCIQLERQHDKWEYHKNKSFKIIQNKKEIELFLRNFPFKPTNSQYRSIDTILSDMEQDYPMSRLLEGDVGSGKTLVAATATYAVVNQNKEIFDNSSDRIASVIRANLQVAYMAPTEILATQHFESFIKYFEGTGIQVGLITGSGCRKFPSKIAMGRQLGKNVSGGVFAMTRSNLPSQDGVRTMEDTSFLSSWTNISRTQLLKWVANGEIPILIGTHALIQKSVKFKNLALVVIDEQHRFGTAQRRKLVRKDNIAPHLLSMTATPIPRTLALTIYGDLDLSLLEEMPAGRKPIITEIITPDKRGETYEKIKKELEAGRQLYIICPRINEPTNEGEVLDIFGISSQADESRKAISRQRNMHDDKNIQDFAVLNMKAVVTEAKRLKKEVFRDYEIGVLHGKMSKQKKEEVMKDFTDGNIHILCATSVIEVGVNVPNATMIIIEGAERFGLAQLHQLRGRVIRSNHQAFCYVFAETKSQKTMDRLKALKTAKNGFELAELDLTLRGAGELGGTKQWGISDLGMEAIKNIKMVEAARTEAIRLITEDPELLKYPLLKMKVHEKVKEFHFE